MADEKELKAQSDEQVQQTTNTAEKTAAENRRARKALKELTRDDDGQVRTNVSLRSILGGDILAGGWFRRQFWYIVMLVAMAVVYVSNRYYCQQEMITARRLNDTLADRRYKALTISSQIKEMTRRSVIEEQLTDSTLKTSNMPLLNLPVAQSDTATEE